MYCKDRVFERLLLQKGENFLHFTSVSFMRRRFLSDISLFLMVVGNIFSSFCFLAYSQCLGLHTYEQLVQ